MAPPTQPISRCSPENGKCRCSQPEKLPASVTKMASRAACRTSAATTAPMSSWPSAGGVQTMAAATGSFSVLIQAARFEERPPGRAASASSTATGSATSALVAA